MRKHVRARWKQMMVMTVMLTVMRERRRMEKKKTREVVGGSQGYPAVEAGVAGQGPSSHGDRRGAHPPPATLFLLFSHTSSSWHWAREVDKHKQQM